MPQEKGILLLTLSDGSKGLFDVTPYLAAEAFMPLKEMSEFQNVRNGGYYIEWACGADLSLDTLLARWTKV
jgi:hypothetical protein